MTITVNGKPQEVADGSTVAELLRQRDLPPERVAVERNRVIVPRATFATVVLEAGDVLEIVTFVGGG
jgi:thiamine biosynthesis protein ThiS